MYFSILFETPEQAELPRAENEPGCFRDLNLDQIIASVLKNKKEEWLRPWYYTPLREESLIAYRQQILSELDDAELCAALSGFSETVLRVGRIMETVREQIRSRDPVNNSYLTRGKMLDCAEQYCAAVTELRRFLTGRALNSRGISALLAYLSEYTGSEFFRSLQSAAEKVRAGFSGLRYSMYIKDDTLRVRKYEEQADQSRQIRDLFDKFRSGAGRDYRAAFSEEPHAEHVEAAALSLLSGLYPEVFRELRIFCGDFLSFEDETIMRFSHEIRFYLSWLEFIRPLRAMGLPFCTPAVKNARQALEIRDAYDLALAMRIGKNIVLNDFILHDPERIFVVTGPNQGGKTTFARTFGQIHYLASIGLSVPCRSGSIPAADPILTHFEREEDISTSNGKLQDDLMRLYNLLSQVTPSSLVIVNEIFASTTLEDALKLGNKMMDILSGAGVYALVVTFLDELAEHGPESVSVMSTVHPDDPSRRTYRILRKPPDGLAYALTLAERHGLTYDQLKRRLAQ